MDDDVIIANWILASGSINFSRPLVCFTKRGTVVLDMKTLRNTPLSVRAVWIIVLIVLVVLVYFWPVGNNDSDLENLSIVEARCPHYSPAYPSAGGPGCSPKCTGRTSSFTAVFYNDTHNWPKDLVHNMHLGVSILKKYGTPTTLNTEHHYLHVNFEYYCCYTPEEVIKVSKFLHSYVWRPHEVRFDRMVCAVHATGGMVSIVLMLDENSQKDLLQWALDNERDLEVQTGVRKHISHTHLQGFHMTLGTVNQSVFPVQPAMKEINTIIPPGTWHSTPIILHRPVCKKCEKLVKRGKAS